MLIQGASMEPTYHNMQMVVLDKNFSEEDIMQGDVIAFKCDKLDAVLVKRVVAIPGQSVEIQDGTLFVNGVPSSYYERGAFEYAGNLDSEIVLGDEEYIVIGDNVDESKDSRYDEVGVVRFQDIRGKIVH